MVYFIRVCGTNYVKIGRAANAKKRLCSIATGNHLPVELCVSVEPKMYGVDIRLEEEAHRHFATQRLRGEWFELAPAAISEWLTATCSPRRFRDWNDREQVQIDNTVENYIPEEVDFPSQVSN